MQHAYNPVEWHPWGEAALQKAKTEDKPILVSIGYAACHWCHVMERESFENEETADYMNRHFVNIKIDREERPDLDHIYMDAVQAISGGGGGWPLNVFLLPDGRPFYGGTYYPPVRAFNRMSWTELLSAIHDMFAEKRNEVESQADNLLHHLSAASSFLQNKTVSDNDFNVEALNTINENLLKAGDKTWGGFGNAPKFPQTFSIQNLLRHYYFTGNEESVKQALLSLDCMIGGGIYDHLGGGFSRYSTDEKWLAPHFEKMLYDNALLVTVLSEAYQLTQNELYADVIRQTLQFINREMTLPEGGWYSALDADSEGVEGKYYTWHKDEVIDILGEKDGEWFCKIYDVSEAGNWEDTNIFWLSHNRKWQQILSDQELKNRSEACKEKLLSARQERIRPQLDDKIILGWNALMITACCKAFAALGDDDFLKMAEKNIRFLEENLFINDIWQHSWKNNRSNHSAFLDDYAYLSWAYVQLQEVTGKSEYLLSAKKVAEYILSHFQDESSSLFYYTPIYQQDVVVRKTEVYDGAIPSGNASVAQLLHYLSAIFDIPKWKAKSIGMVRTILQAIIKYPGSFGVWAILTQEIVYGTNEIIIAGENGINLLLQLQKSFIGNRIILTALQPPKAGGAALSKFQDRFKTGKTFVYVCRDNTCKQPVEKVEEALILLR